MPEKRNPLNLSAAQLRRLQTLQAENESLKQEMAKVVQRAKDLEQSRRGLEAEIARNRQELADAGKELTQARKKLDTERKELNAVRKEFNLVQKELEKTGKRHQADQLKFLAQKTEIEERLAAAGKETEELRGKLAGEKNDWSREREKLTKTLETLKRENQKLVEAEGLDSQVGDLIALNRSLQEELDSVHHSQRLLEGRIKDIQAEATAAARRELVATKKEMQKLQRSISTLTRENSSLLYQLQQENKVPVLSPERVSRMLNEFQESLQAGMKNVEIREGEVKLKIGIAAVDEHSAGFIIPSAANISEFKEGLSEISIRFGKGSQKIISPPDAE